MEDHAGTLGQHARKQRPVEPHRWHEVELTTPLLIAESGEAAGGGRGTAEHIDEDVDATEAFLDGVTAAAQPTARARSAAM